MKFTCLMLLVLLTSCGKDNQGVQTPENTVEYTTFDPCGDDSRYEDNLLYKSDLGIFAFMPVNGKSVLVQLTDGWYVTSEGQNCYFEVRGNIVK